MRPGTASTRHWKTQTGFGLIEQIVVLAVVAVLATLAIPSFQSLVEGQQLRSAQADYIAALQQARGIAINEQMRIVFCPSRDARTCNSDVYWTGGWLMGRDPNNNGQPEGSPLYVGGKYASKIDIIASDSKKSVRFKPDGTAGNSNLTLLICLRGQSTRARVVVIARRGRVMGRIATAEEAARCAADDQD